ncbi:hypothetical protein [Persicobacter psychrovividus]|uniref:DNA-binding transcriptional activator of the SARP family n=1 Tax=Persicobacter psychrovividus TaxID=387638 RepID=A0ABM7VM12_9BACT|nr:hypothetical protein PEPS_42940 [Persicobacter psychrovividus]
MIKYYFTILLCFALNSSFAKYGLRIYGQEYPITERTMCQFFVNQAPELGDGFQINFNMSTIDDQYNEFGYIFRAVTAQGKKMDLIYQVADDTYVKISLLLGSNKKGELAIRVNRRALSNWQQVQIKANLEKNQYQLSVEGVSNQLQYNYFSPADHLKFYFGVNDQKGIATRDAINMKIRHVEFQLDNEPVADWKLDQVEGQRVNDTNGEYTASLKNPKWIRKDFTFWKPLSTHKLNGYAEVVYNHEQQKIYFVGSDQLLIIDPEKPEEAKQVFYDKPVALERGHQNFIYDEYRHEIVAYSVDHLRQYAFSMKEKKWENEFDFKMPDQTDYLHHSRYISPNDSSIYTLFGYGHHMFRKSISNFKERTRDKNTEAFPRYLAGFGLNQEKTKGYILGGYGNEYGEQKYSPHYFNQLMEYDLPHRTFKVLHTYDTARSHGYFASSNQLVVGKDHFYALLFKKNQFQGKLQLFKGSISTDSLYALADGIPYKFHDIRSFADLYYNDKLDKLYAVTTFCSDKETSLNIYSISLPIFVPENEPDIAENNQWWILAVGFLSLILAAGGYGFYRKHQAPKSVAHTPEEIKPTESKTIAEPAAVIKNQGPDRSYIKILSGFSAYDKDGNSISKKFSGLRQELFIILVMNSVNEKNGISSEYLIEYFWSDKSSKDAKNNKNVNISKLKELLKLVGGMEIVNNSGYLKLKVDESVAYVDYVKFCHLIKEPQLTDQNLIKLRAIAEGLTNIRSLNSNDWYDKLKSQVSAKSLDYFSAQLNKNSSTLAKHTIVDICSAILKLDTVNEQAMSLKCQHLVEMGHHSSARSTYDKFIEEYKTLFDEDFDLTFKEVLKESFIA